MSESSPPNPQSMHDKGLLYAKLISKVSGTSEGGQETIILDDLVGSAFEA